jgi:hypothetical protein
MSSSYPGAKFMTSCDASVVMQSHEAYLKRINRLVRDNAVALALCAAILLVCAVVILAVISMVRWTVRSHRQRTAANGTAPEKKLDLRDDIAYADGSSDVDPSLPKEAERTAVKRKLREIEGRYGTYNKAISDFLTSKGREVDEVIDKRIMSRDDDDYTYSKTDVIRSGVVFT